VNSSGESGLTISATLAAEIQAAAGEEHRPAADVLKDAVTGYLENRRWRLREENLRQARKLGLADDAGSMTDEYRRAIAEKIAEGIEQARQGRLVDGNTVFVRIEAELGALETESRR
jgi:hypothetical protein